VGAIRNVVAALISDGQDDFLAELFGGPQGAKPKAELIAGILARIREPRGCPGYPRFSFPQFAWGKPLKLL
jgi:hypothetical protein